LNIGGYLRSSNLSYGQLELLRKNWENSDSVSYGSHLTRFRWRTQANDTWRTICSINDFHGIISVTASDSNSGDRGQWSARITSPAYGVSNMEQVYYHNGGWNTGSFSLQYVNISGTYYLQGKASSYYSSSEQFYWEFQFNIY